MEVKNDTIKKKTNNLKEEIKKIYIQSNELI